MGCDVRAMVVVDEGCTDGPADECDPGWRVLQAVGNGSGMMLGCSVGSSDGMDPGNAERNAVGSEDSDSDGI